MTHKTSFQLEIKGLSEEGTFEGLLSVYDVVDHGKDLVERGAFTKTISERGADIPLLWQHKADMPIGKLTVEDSPEGLKVKGELLLDIPEAKKAYLLMKAGIVKGLSIGYEAVKKAMSNGVRHLKEVKLYEGSVVTFPMNEMALITAVKSMETKGDFNEELALIQVREAGWQIMSALRQALNSVCGFNDYGSYSNPKLTPEEKLAASLTIIDQFREAYSTYLPQYLKMMSDAGYKSAEEFETKAGRAISAATREKLQSAVDLLSALIPSEAGTATPEDEPATKSEPVEDHSAASTCIDEIQALLRAA